MQQLPIRSKPLYPFLILVNLSLFFVGSGCTTGNDSTHLGAAASLPSQMTPLSSSSVGVAVNEQTARTARPSTVENARYPIGMNLAGVVDWTTEWPLVDVFKSSRPWVTSDWKDARSTPGYAFDVQGNPLLKPGQMVQTLMLREIGGHYPAGVYVVTYQGTGKIAFGPSDVKQVVKVSKGRMEIRVEPGDGGIILQVTASDVNDPIRAVHVWMPGFENAKSPFHPRFLERLKPFRTLRFMDWQQTNNSPVKRWSERPMPRDLRYTTPSGVPLELMIELANTLDADPWFCLPHQADDAFVRNFATLVKQKLNPDRRAYVEYSNEVWNGQFGQARYALQQGKKSNSGASDFELQLRYYSERSVEIFKIWESVFGADSEKRLVRVMASQAANAWVSEQVLSWKDAAQHVDALAIAPYFGGGFGDPQTQATVAKMRLDQLLDAVEKEVGGQNRDWLKEQADVARKFKVQLVAYEGGQHLVGVGGAENNDALTALFIAANRSPRMAELYRKHLDNWFKAGGGTFVAFSNVSKPSKWGSWGVLEYQDQPEQTAPKYAALRGFLSQPQAFSPPNPKR